MYSIPSSCGVVYVCKTDRLDETRLVEHPSLQSGHLRKSVAEHQRGTGHRTVRQYICPIQISILCLRKKSWGHRNYPLTSTWNTVLIGVSPLVWVTNWVTVLFPYLLQNPHTIVREISSRIFFRKFCRISAPSHTVYILTVFN